MSDEAGYRMWLKRDGKFLIGEGRARLLRLVKETNSIAKAAEKMGMSYRHARGAIEEIEGVMGTRVVNAEEEGFVTLTYAGERLLEEYTGRKERFDQQLIHLYKNPTLTVDGLILIKDRLVLIRRGRSPFKGMYALPGGIVEYGESTEFAVTREVEEETGLETEILQLVGVYSDPGRDPRGHFVTVVYQLHPVGGELRSGDDASEIFLCKLDQIPELAFEHDHIIRDFLDSKRLRP